MVALLVLWSISTQPSKDVVKLLNQTPILLWILFMSNSLPLISGVLIRRRKPLKSTKDHKPFNHTPPYTNSYWKLWIFILMLISVMSSSHLRLYSCLNYLSSSTINKWIKWSNKVLMMLQISSSLAVLMVMLEKSMKKVLSLCKRKMLSINILKPTKLKKCSMLITKSKTA